MVTKQQSQIVQWCPQHSASFISNNNAILRIYNWEILDAQLLLRLRRELTVKQYSECCLVMLAYTTVSKHYVKLCPSVNTNILLNLDRTNQFKWIRKSLQSLSYVVTNKNCDDNTELHDSPVCFVMQMSCYMWRESIGAKRCTVRDAVITVHPKASKFVTKFEIAWPSGGNHVQGLETTASQKWCVMIRKRD